jgi:cholinesterase
MGESAGGASIMHQITAYGGMKGPVPFQQAILQSAAWLPSPSPSIQESIFQSFLDTAGVSTLQEARGLSTEALQLANYIMVGEAPYGDFLFSKFFRLLHIGRTDYITDPGIDGSFVPQLPGQLLLHGGYDQSLRVMAGHQVNEGFALTTPFLPNDEAFKENIILVSFNDASNDTIDLLMNTYYPAPADGQYDLLGQIARGRDLVTEALFTCNANYITRAFGANSYSYVFSVPPSIHAQDLPYTFFNGPAPPVGGSVENATLALIMQDYFTNFAITGDPNGPELPYFPDYSGGMSQNLNLTFIDQIPDYLANERCLWWQKALYY